MAWKNCGMMGERIHFVTRALGVFEVSLTLGAGRANAGKGEGLSL